MEFGPERAFDNFLVVHPHFQLGFLESKKSDIKPFVACK